jgi:hypothetical protein
MRVCIDTNVLVQLFDPLIGSGYKPQPITPQEFIQTHL